MPTPTNEEQLTLQYINLLRTDPGGEYARLTDPSVYGQISYAVSFFGVDLGALRQQLATLVAVAPVAWNSQIADAAASHNAQMIAQDRQGHVLAGEPDVGARLTAAGYRWNTYGENVYAYSAGAFFGHAGFVIDWGYDSIDYDASGALLPDWRSRGDGMQDPAGHRINLLGSGFTEIGIAITPESSSQTSVGPFVTTEDLANRSNYQAQFLGAVINDRDGDRFYDIGEGLGGVTVTLTRGAATYTTTSWSSGGWQIAVPSGTYTIQFSGGGLPGTIDAVGTISGSNVLLNVYTTDVTLLRPSEQSDRADFNADGRSDILWRNADGGLSTWTTSGAQYARNTFYANVGTAWTVQGTFDFNGDGRSDILWRDASGTVSVWTAEGANGFRQGAYTVGSPGSDWRIAGAGDLNGDGKDDLLWQRADGAISSWNATGSDFAMNSYFHGSPGAGWKVEGLADFDGDGRDDLLWRNTGGALSEWRSAGSGFTETTFFDTSVGTGWHVAGLADVNGDGRDDIVWRNDDGGLSLWQSTGSSGFVRNSFYASVGTDWQVAQVADFNGDGRADLLWHRNSGAISLWQSNGSGFDQNVLYDAGAPPSWSIQAHEWVV